MEGVIIEIKYRTAAYTEDPKNPEKPKLLYKNRLKRATLDTNDIIFIAEYHGKTGKKSTKRCEIKHRDLGEILVEIPYRDMVLYKLDNRVVVKGFHNPLIIKK